MSHIVSRSMKRLKNEKMDSLLVITRNNNRIEKISYDTSSMLNIKNKIIENIEKELNDIEKISHEYYSSPNQEKSKNKFKNWKNGYICEVNINAIQGSTLFGNIGPSIPIKLSYMGYTYVDIDMDVEEYGINNVIVRINAIIKISNLITMPISTKVHEVVIKEPLSIEIINGDIPNYLIAGNK
ncbi:MAG: sporulation protein YunB [Bacilli bacterium]|nr:sporulation protein YunB [Bacilli bacterium]